MDQFPYDPSVYEMMLAPSMDTTVRPRLNSGNYGDLIHFNATIQNHTMSAPPEMFFGSQWTPVNSTLVGNENLIPQYNQILATQGIREGHQPPVIRSRNRLTKQEWEAQKPNIEFYYYDQNLSLADTIEIMKTKGFYASKRKYKEKLKFWGLDKNIPLRQRNFIKKKALSGRKLNRQVAFTYKERPVPSKKVEGYCRNQTRSDYSATGETVSGIGYRDCTPPPARTPPPVDPYHSTPIHKVDPLLSAGEHLYDDLQLVQENQSHSPTQLRQARVDAVIAENATLFHSNQHLYPNPGNPYVLISDLIDPTVESWHQQQPLERA